MRKIAIICGGDSSEHDVSMRSGAGLYSFFDKERYDVKLVETRGLEWNVHLADGIMAPIDRNDFTYMENGEKKNFDYVYITIHGAPGENGVLQGYFELLGIPYSTCGVLVEALTFDKFALNNYLRAFGVNVADSVLIRKTDKQRLSNADVVARLGLPCFVKPSADGSSYGVSKVKSVDEMDAAL